MRVLMLDIDTLRPDHMSCYGYDRKTTPNIDSICKDGVKFSKCYTPSAPCAPSRAALVSGKYGIHNGLVGHGGTCGDRRLVGATRENQDQMDVHNFHTLFRNAGLHTVSFNTFAERHSANWFNFGFNEVYNVGKCGMESGEEVAPLVEDWLNEKGDKDNWFMHVNLWDPHTPYRTPKDYVNPFKDDDHKPWITKEIFDEHRAHVGPHSLQELNMFDDKTSEEYPKYPGKVEKYEDLNSFLDGYDCGVNFADYYVGRIIDILKAKNIYEDTAIIVISDHGENLGEFGIYGEHATADEPTCHIPLIIKWPGCVKNKVDNDFHYNIDLVPTVADLFNQEKYDKWDGQSFADVLRTNTSVPRNHLVFSQFTHTCQRSVRFGKWLYIRTYHGGFHLFDKEMLFDIENDKYERNDLKINHPELCAKGAKYILDWHDEQMLKSESTIDPLWTVLAEKGPYYTWNNYDSYLERLEHTGREEGAKKFISAYGEKKK